MKINILIHDKYNNKNLIFFFLTGVMTRTLLSELFPVNIRSKATSVVTTSFELSAFFINKIFPIISDKYGTYFMFIIFCVTNVSLAVFTYLIVIETKGKTYEEIQEILNR